MSEKFKARIEVYDDDNVHRGTLHVSETGETDALGNPTYDLQTVSDYGAQGARSALYGAWIAGFLAQGALAQMKREEAVVTEIMSDDDIPRVLQ